MISPGRTGRHGDRFFRNIAIARDRAHRCHWILNASTVKSAHKVNVREDSLRVKRFSK